MKYFTCYQVWIPSDTEVDYNEIFDEDGGYCLTPKATKLRESLEQEAWNKLAKASGKEYWDIEFIDYDWE